MDRYRVFETETFQEDLAQIGRSGLSRIAEKLREHVYPQLRTEPHYGPNIKELEPTNLAIQNRSLAVLL